MLFLAIFWLFFAPFLPISGPCSRCIGFFLVMFCEVDCKIKQNRAGKAKNANFCQNSAKVHRNDPKLTFQPVKVCSKRVRPEVSWVDFECFYALAWRSRWLLNRFFLLLLIFWPFLSRFWQYLGLHRAILGWFWTIFESIRGHFMVTLGSFWHRFGIILGLFGIVLTSFWDLWAHFLPPFLGHFCRFRAIFGPFGAFFAHFWAIFTVILWFF